MRTNFRRVLVTLGGLTFAALASLAFNGSSPAAQADFDHLVIEGGWLFAVTPPAGGPPPFQALDTFSAGGGWAGQASTDAQNGLSLGQGSWKRSRGAVIVTQVQFSHDAAGNPTGTVVIHKKVRFTGPDSLEGSSTISFCDLSGENCFTPPGCARVVATRVRPVGPDCDSRS
jgi:hypothetical protein